jgi:hypothetical protein
MADSAPSVHELDLYDPIRLAVSRARVGLLFRNHVGLSQHDGRDHKVRHGLPKGSSDLVGWTLPGSVHRGGMMLCVEVKLPGWKPSPKWKKDRQAKWIDAVNDAGGVAFVSRSPEETVAVLRGELAPIYPL